MKPQQQPSILSSSHPGAEHVFLLIHRLRLTWLLAHLPPTFVWAAYVSLNSFLTIALLTLLALITHSPFVFPSLGPTAFLFFFTPLAPSASPRNAVLGHAIGLLCGFFAYTVTSTHAFPQGFAGEIYWSRILASALALSLTGAVMVLLHVNHPPAGATTMIVSLDILSKPEYLPAIEIAVVLLAAQAFAINRLAGLPYPIWQRHTLDVGGAP
jgi:CBS-domain-containing membrane protein